MAKTRPGFVGLDSSSSDRVKHLDPPVIGDVLYPILIELESTKINDLPNLMHEMRELQNTLIISEVLEMPSKFGELHALLLESFL